MHATVVHDKVIRLENRVFELEKTVVSLVTIVEQQKQQLASVETFLARHNWLYDASEEIVHEQKGG